MGKVLHPGRLIQIQVVGRVIATISLENNIREFHVFHVNSYAESSSTL